MVKKQAVVLAKIVFEDSQTLNYSPVAVGAHGPRTQTQTLQQI